MSINKGLKSLVESSPNFSNQGLENAINDGFAANQKAIDANTSSTKKALESLV